MSEVTHDPLCPWFGSTVVECDDCCICDRLSACEERVRESWYEVQSETWVQGYAAALNAAREAVDGLDKYQHGQISAADALEAIDALRDREDMIEDHKPECPMLDEQWPKHPLEKCVYCDMISACEQRVWDVLRACEQRVWDVFRACEQRVRLEDDDYAYVAAQSEAEGRRQGWDDALDTAQEVIAALDKVGQGQDYVLGVFDSLSAIETLKHNTSP